MTKLALPEVLCGHHDNHALWRGRQWRDEFRTKPPAIGDYRVRRNEGAKVVLEVLEALYEDGEGLVDRLLDGRLDPHALRVGLNGSLTAAYLPGYATVQMAPGVMVVVVVVGKTVALGEDPRDG